MYLKTAFPAECDGVSEYSVGVQTILIPWNTCTRYIVVPYKMCRAAAAALHAALPSHLMYNVTLQFEHSVQVNLIPYTADGLRKAGIEPSTYPTNHIKIMFCPGGKPNGPSTPQQTNMLRCLAGKSKCPNKTQHESHMFAMKISRAADGRGTGMLVAGCIMIITPS